ncbi:hypothetical protein K438DRAFT_1767520 [Mycena galopus ATCC 62051]|nr:hypothetical protein K438DRAFT_1767520 [Mycena galopus ATCC 62051]
MYILKSAERGYPFVFLLLLWLGEIGGLEYDYYPHQNRWFVGSSQRLRYEGIERVGEQQMCQLLPIKQRDDLGTSRYVPGWAGRVAARAVMWEECGRVWHQQPDMEGAQQARAVDSRSDKKIGGLLCYRQSCGPKKLRSGHIDSPDGRQLRRNATVPPAFGVPCREAGLEGVAANSASATNSPATRRPKSFFDGEHPNSPKTGQH